MGHEKKTWNYQHLTQTLGSPTNFCPRDLCGLLIGDFVPFGGSKLVQFNTMNFKLRYWNKCISALPSKTHLNLNKYPSKLTLLGKSLLEKLFWCEKRNRDEFLLPISTNNRHPVQFLFGMLQKIGMSVASLDAQVVSGSLSGIAFRDAILLLGGAYVNYRFFGWIYPHFIAWKNRIPWYHPLHDNDIFKLNVSTLMEHHRTRPPIFNLIFGRLRFQSSASLEDLGGWSARSNWVQ